MINLLFFTESGLGVASLLVEQFFSIKQQNPDKTIAVISSMEQQVGLIDEIKKDEDFLELNGLESHKHFKEHIRLLKECILLNDINVVHVQTNWELALVIVVKNIIKKDFKVIYTIHSYRNHKSYFEALFFKYLLGLLFFLFVDKIICSCNSIGTAFSFLKKKIIILPLGVSSNFFKERETPSSNSLIMIYPAAFRVGKNQDMLLESFEKYITITKDEDSMLYLPGNGSLLSMMRKIVKQKQLESRVILPGLYSRQMLQELYGKCNVALISSKSETFGHCIAEPYVLGKCIITRNVGVAQDIIVNNENGYIYSTTEELTKILIYLHNNPAYIEKTGKSNYNNKDLFNWNIITKKYLSHINYLINAKGDE